MVAACGRLGFDPLGHGSVTGDGPLASDTGSPGDGSGGGGGSGSGTLVQQSPVASGTTSVVVTLPNPTTAGTLLVAAIAANDLTSFTPPAGWQLNANGFTSGSCAAGIATLMHGPGGQTSLTFTFAVGVPAAVEVSEWAGVSGTDNGGFASGTTPTMSLSVSTALPDAAAGDLAIATFCEDANSPMFAGAAGWGSLGQLQNTSSSPSLFAEYRRDQPAATVTATATGTVNAKYTAAIVTIR